MLSNPGSYFDHKSELLTKDVTVETNTLTDALDGMDNEDETEKEVITYELARRDTNKKLKRKENKTKNHGASDQFCLITKRLHNSKMAANTRKDYYHVIEMAAYKLDNNFWREKHKMEDVKMDSCLLPEIKHWTMEWKNKIYHILEQMYVQTNVQKTWEGFTYGNIERNNVKIQNKNGEDPTCQNVGGQNTNLETKKNTTKADIQIALQTGV